MWRAVEGGVMAGLFKSPGIFVQTNVQLDCTFV